MNPLEDFLIGQVELDFLPSANIDRGAKEIRFSRSKKTKVEKALGKTALGFKPVTLNYNYYKRSTGSA